MEQLKYDLNFEEGCQLLIDKPQGWTSHDVVNKVKFALKHKNLKTKVGHSGTLDPLATGLMIVHTGRMTKQLQELQGLDKVYDGIITLGSTTESYDLEQPVVFQSEVNHLLVDELFDCFRSFVGHYSQIPPVHSAIQKDGKRAYDSARKGIAIELAPRDLLIHRFDITKIDLPKITFDVHCSKGTYIRALARDVGEKLGVGAYLSSLRRTEIGDFNLADAWQLDDLMNHIETLEF